MKKIVLLVVLRWRMLINEYKKKSPNFLFLFASFIILFFGGYGYFIGYSAQISEMAKEAINWNKVISNFLILFTLIVVSKKIYSPSRLVSSLNLKALLYLPVNIVSILFVDLILGLVDFSYLLVVSLGVGILASLMNSANSISIFFIVIVFIFFIVLIIHLLTEILTVAIRLLNSVSKSFFVRLLSILSFGIFLFLLFNNGILIRTYESFWAHSFKLLGVCLVGNNSIPIFNIVIKNLILFLILFSLYFGVRYIDIFLLLTYSNSYSVNQDSYMGKWYDILKKIKIKSIIYFIKDIKYLWRNQNVLIINIGELIVYLFIYCKYSNNITGSRPLILLFMSCVLPLFIWDSYLSNCFGTEKSGFGIYLITNTYDKAIILAKNFSFFSLRLIFIIFACIFWGFLLTYHIIVFIILLQMIISISLATFGNINSLRNPYPVDLDENVFTKNRKMNFSFIGFIGLFICFIVSIILLLSLYVYEYTLTSYVIFSAFFVLAILIYWISLNRIVRLFKMSKIYIFNKIG